MIVHTISSFELPWICVGTSSSGCFLARNWNRMIATAAITSTPTTPAMMNTGTCRLLIFWACEPFGSKMFCGVLLSEHPTSTRARRPKGTSARSRSTPFRLTTRTLAVVF